MDIIHKTYRVNWAFRNALHAWGEGALVELSEADAAHVNACSPGVLTLVEAGPEPVAEPEVRDIAEAPNDRMIHAPVKRRGRPAGSGKAGR